MKFAVTSAWPEIKNAEYEVIERIKIASKNIGVQCVVVDDEGYIIGEDDKRTDVYLKGDEVEFVIALHFITEKLFTFTCKQHDMDFFVHATIQNAGIQLLHHIMAVRIGRRMIQLNSSNAINFRALY